LGGINGEGGIITKQANVSERPWVQKTHNEEMGMRECDEVVE
jgi:hypothetical protein